ncbi:CheR family methyltransferase [Emcibacter nanhaiensis]|uniref:Chemotaxis protein methyltransferase n=1 Tax=Emcibacter nanhaiensis TaxID=1505037 RepID=A0A501PKZ5_9PROT|nr:CheR family methyltransferase [Emcibacter nanhaiensis]TPD60737.1 chemotaxis protein CheR [Emcibacter nanhaiensis]
MGHVETSAKAATEAKNRLSDETYMRIASIINKHSGIKLPPAKRLMVEGRLRKRAQICGHNSLDDYCSYLFENGGLDDEFVHLVDAITTNKTDFFREPDHFTLLRNSLLQSLIGLRRSGARAKLKIWSAASSNGAEAYTIAMVMAEEMARHGNMEFSILGTDISSAMVTAARRAIYPTEMITPVSEELQEKYIMRARIPERQGQVRIVPELRRRVRFELLNLMNESYAYDRDVDVIFLRNVLIYFDKPTQEAVTCRMMEHLRPGGYLFLGHSESMIGTNLRLHQVAPAVFQKV